MRSLIPDELDEQLNSLQIDIASKQIPVIILFEGGSGRVIGRIISELDRNLEPMGIRYFHLDSEKKSSAALADIMNSTPAKGEIVLYDRSWYSLAVDHCTGDDEVMKEQIEGIRGFEEFLLNNGIYIIKIGYRMSNENLRKHIYEYRARTPISNTFLSVDHIDRVKFRAVMPRAMELLRLPTCS